MKCEMCGYEHEEQTCKSCGEHGCGECRCPACGYSKPPQSRVISFFKKIGR